MSRETIEWIDVKERLPEDDDGPGLCNRNVLVHSATRPQDGRAIASCEVWNTFSGERRVWEWPDGVEITLYEITHWAEMPKGPAPSNTQG